MSLRVFHIFFITVSILLADGFGYWALSSHELKPDPTLFGLGVASLAASTTLVAYLVWYIRKSKK